MSAEPATLERNTTLNFMRAASTSNRSHTPSTGAARLWQRDTNGVGLTTTITWLMILIMIIPQGLDYAGINGMPMSSDYLSRIVWLIILGGGVMLLLQKSARTKIFIKWLNPFLLLFLALAAASVLWSIEPKITFRRVLRAFSIIATCGAFALIGWNPRRFQTFMRTILMTIMIASVIFIIISPDMAIHRSNQPELKDAWHGITTGKNVLGSLASLCIILWLHGAMSKQVSSFTALLGASVAALCLIMSRSATSLMATAFGVIFMLLLLRSPGTLRRYMPYIVAIFAGVILLYAIAVLRIVPGLDFILKPITMITGKDMTFTGRAAIWEVLNENIRRHPWLGTGYGAYWIGATPTSPSFEMLTRLYFYPSEGHNGYLDVINDLGAVGLICLLGYFWSYIGQSLRLMKLDRYQGALYLTLLFRAFLADMSESHWFLCLANDFAIMTLATTSLSRSLLQAELDRALAASTAAQQPGPVANQPTSKLNPLRSRYR